MANKDFFSWFAPTPSDKKRNSDIEASIHIAKRKKITSSDYVHLIDVKTRSAMQQMEEGDYLNPAGFVDLTKATPAQLEYFSTKSTLEYMIKNDIMENKSRNNQLKAYKKWINIADLLLKKDNYEGFLLIVSNLASLDIHFKLADELSASSQNKLTDFSTLINPPLKDLQQYINEHNNKQTLMPVLLLSRIFTRLESELKDSTIMTSDMIAKNHAAREKLLSEITPVTEIKVLPTELQSFFKLMEIRSKREQTPVANPQANSDTSENPSNKKLRPYFWNTEIKLNRLCSFIDLAPKGP